MASSCDSDSKNDGRLCPSSDGRAISSESTATDGPSPTNNAVVVQCGVLTVNRHRYALEYDSCAEPSSTAAGPRATVAATTSMTTVKPLHTPKSKARSIRPTARASKTSAKRTPTAGQPDSICICTIHSRYELIGTVASQLGWRCSRDCEASNVIWTDSIMGVEMCRYMRRFQKINHFPGMFEICRKDLLARNMNRMLKLFPLDYAIFPKTWHLPADYGEAVRFARSHRNRTYILKPDQGAQGRGIRLVRSLKTISPTDHIIMQLYVARPLLIDGFKFDLRVYALITCIDPLRVYVYNEGLARFATSAYREPRGHNTSNMFMHLTNYSVNRYSRTFSTDDEVGSKRKFSTLNRILAAEGYDVAGLWTGIDEVVVKTVASAWPVLRHSYAASFPQHDVQHACFEILGVDVLIDERLKPWLLEVNHSPSFHCNGPVDRHVKHALIRDTFELLNVRVADKRRVLEEDKRRVNERLLRRINERSAGAADPTVADVVPPMTPPACSLAQAAQFDWEDRHLGGFRRVLPAPGDPDKYAPFLDPRLANNQASVFADTVTSKIREEEARLLRASIAEREKFPVAVKMFCPPVGQSEADQSGLATAPKRHRRRPRAVADGFRMEPVSDAEEWERVALMAQRDFLVRSCGVLPYIYVGFHRNNMLTEKEMKRYKDVDVRHLMDAELRAEPPGEQKLRLNRLATGDNNHSTMNI